jgi:NAD(P)-dependent dehydrogenase (short-subunit alcohol dehydrogenase family)
MLLQDKVAIVSGVGPGLGREVAVACAREGAKLVVAARSEDKLRELAAEIQAGGGEAIAVPTDITDVGQCERLAAAAIEQFGRIDVLVNNAFRPDVFRTFSDVDLDDWRTIFEVNVFGNLQVTKAVLPHMKSRHSGSIVFVNSMVVRKPALLQAGYTASKGALLVAAQGLAKELGPDGIRVNSVLPGWMDGPSVDTYFKIREKYEGVSRDDAYAEIAKEIPLGFIPKDEDVANVVVFLASEMASIVTGQSLDANGGEVFH